MATVSALNLFPQSPYLNLMAAGSDGSDGSAPGIHLRWHLLGTLGENHLPKGNLAQEDEYNTNILYNKQNDFVHVYRTEYNQLYEAEVHFADQLTQADQLKESGDYREWVFDDLIPVPDLPNEKCQLVVRFSNTSKYDQVRVNYNPLSGPLNFLKEYNEILETWVKDQIFFSVNILVEKDPNNTQSAYTKIEAIVKEENTSDSLFLIDARKTFFRDATGILLKENEEELLLEDGTFIRLEAGGEGSVINKMVHENMQYVRFRNFNCYPKGIRIETYHHFLKGVNSQQNNTGGWTFIGDFALSTDDNTVFERLEKPGIYDVHNSWPKFNDVSKLNIQNYKDKWLSGDQAMPGLKKGLIEFLKASTTDPQGVATIAGGADGKVADSTINTWVIGGRKEEVDLPLLELLSTVTTDYHVARMLGLGHIDNVGIVADTSKKYIHLATYETSAPLDNFSGTYTHSYMTLGTSKSDQKLPKTPEIELSYGLYATDINDEKTLISDEEGYFPNADMRAINVELTNHIPVEDAWDVAPPFFVPDADFDNSHTLAAISYGIEYKRTEEQFWRSPELSHDPDFLDTAGKPETNPILWPLEDKPLYIHFEKEAGSHDYGAYSINWFSRASPVSYTRTAVTTFPKSYSLLPPFNFSALLIQEEEPDALFVTTIKEQLRLLAIANEDPSLVRVMFNWDDLQNRNYFPCDKVRIVFREPLLKSKKGQIKSVEIKKVILQGKSKQVTEVRTKSYLRFSVSPPENISPDLNFGSNEQLPFIGGAFSVEGVPYLIREILPSTVAGEGPVFLLETVKKRIIVQGADANDYGNLGARNEYDMPPLEALFTVFENLADQSNWTTTLQKEIDIVQWSNYSEKVIEKGSGEEKEFTIGGITQRVNITEVSVKDPLTAVASDRTGIYKLEFSTNPLTEHPLGTQTVEWYSGVVRISLTPGASESLEGEIRRLDVIGIDNSTSAGKLTLFAIDNQFASQGAQLDYTPIPEGPNVLVNFHPGYRVYLYAENGFNTSTLYNYGNAESHDSYIAAYSVDSTKGLSSYVCPPVRLRAQKIHKPKQPEKPTGPEFATKPNFYGKSTYTFETAFSATDGRKPYSIQFARGNDMAILQTLYSTKTVDKILQVLAALPNDTFYYDRLRDLADVKTGTDFKFKTYGEGENAYAYPLPDNEHYTVPYTNYIHPVTGAILDPIRPFAGNTGIFPGSEAFVVGNTADYPYKNTEEWKMLNVVKEAILGSFLPLTEMPVIYASIKKAPYEPQNIKPTLRDRSAQLLETSSPLYDPAPMAVITSETSDEVKVRFVDYTLDGASNRLQFYFAREMTNSLALGPVSDVLGPIQLINTSPASAPQIEKVISQAEDLISGDQAGVVFEITNYLAAEKISKFRIYRTSDALSATSSRTMQLAKTVSSGEQIADYFEDIDYVPFGDVLYYRLVAIREVKMPDGTVEEIESLPSNIAVTNLIDVVNPEAPEIRPTVGVQTESALQEVTLEWDRTAYNATYHLYKMTASGNWTRIYDVKSNEAVISYKLPEGLLIKNEDDEPVYHRFKVTVENSSGLLNLEDKEITLPIN